MRNSHLINDFSLSYSEYDKKRGKESGEKIQIELFWRIIEYLTVNESLYILNKNNYKKDVYTFQKDYKNINEKKIDELLDDTFITFLKSLVIDAKELYEDNKRKYYMPDKFKESIIGEYPMDEPRHPITFYYDNCNDNILQELLKYFQGEKKIFPSN